VHEQRCRRGIAVSGGGDGIVNRGQPQKHEFSIAFDGFDLPSRQMLLKRGGIVDEVRLSETYRDNSPTDDSSPQSTGYCFDFG
jgi:hypothetical protein